jgi:hypothetical protein
LERLNRHVAESLIGTPVQDEVRAADESPLYTLAYAGPAPCCSEIFLT